MIGWIKTSEELPTEDGFYLIWSARPFVAWYDSKNKLWEISKHLKVRADSKKTITHWYKITEPRKEI